MTGERRPGPGSRRVRKVLIANRGEIAVRVARACRDAGLASVAVYASQDRDAMHVWAADEAVPLRGASPARTYLDMPRVLRAAAESGADAVHPGYGFLADSAEFAQAVLDAGLTWIGPSPAAIRLLGDKLAARQVARGAGVPLLPGMTASSRDAAQVVAFAREHGLPVVLKTASGGGGRGIAVARSAEEIPRAYARIVQAAGGALMLLFQIDGMRARVRLRWSSLITVVCAAGMVYGAYWLAQLNIYAFVTVAAVTLFVIGVPVAAVRSATPSVTWTARGTWKPSAWQTGTARLW